MANEHSTANVADVVKLRALFEDGAALVKDTAEVAYGIPERRFRAAVAALRLQGYPVVSWSEEGSTYRKARDRAELDRFIDGELIPRMRKLEAEARAMRTLGKNWLEAQTRLI